MTTSKLALSLATAVFALSPLSVAASAPLPPVQTTLTASQRILIQSQIATLLLAVQKLQQQLAAIQSQTMTVVVTASTTATTTPGTIAVSASTTPSSATLQPTITVSVNGTTFTRGQPMTVTWTTNAAFGIDPDPVHLPYLELFPYGANPIMVPSVRVARPGNATKSYVWFVSKTGVLGDTVTTGKYLVQIGLYNPVTKYYVIGANPIPVTITP